METVSRIRSAIRRWLHGPPPAFRPTFRALHPNHAPYNGQPFAPIREEYAEHQGFFWLVRFPDGHEEWVEEECVVIR